MAEFLEQALKYARRRSFYDTLKSPTFHLQGHKASMVLRLYNRLRLF